ncbi:CSLREA domain-containing protein [Acinetobacter defluvii]|uniref:CSLREA domain-containing protein n=1 Tax=Acinetobacter defluvii TaxID=1871111 RepID=UPI003AF9C994
MKHYKKGILTLMVLSAMSLMAAEDKTIYVTTFADENGENPDKCSLREAITAAATHKAFGGCSAGQERNNVTNVIHLQEGEYKLNSELKPSSALIIYGKEPTDYSQLDVLTNDYPAATAIKTTINAQGLSRIFNTNNTNSPTIVLNNLKLINGSSQNDRTNAGGALYLGGQTELNNVSIESSTAQTGGAIYLNDINSSLTINGGVFQKNNANTGSLLAMTCSDKLNYSKRVISISSASFLGNGSANSNSMFAFCGQPEVKFTANTITQNTANATNGSIIQFSSSTPQGSVSLSDLSSINLLSNTIVKNEAWSTFLYNASTSKTLGFNVLAYNGIGKSCRYTGNDLETLEKPNFTLVSNAFALSATSANSVCELPKKTADEAVKNSVDISTVGFDHLLSTLQPASRYTGFMPLYFPKSNTSTSLIDSKAYGCSGYDQRGVGRVKSEDLKTSDQSNSCDIGSTEILRLTAFKAELSNSSAVTLLEQYKNYADKYKSLIEDKNTKPEYLPLYKIQKKYYENLLNIKTKQKYRTIFFDPFVTNLPHENLLSNGGREIKHLTADNYTVTAVAKGIGNISGNIETIKPDNNLHCEWDASLGLIKMWRVDDRITPTGDKEFCQYTLTLKPSVNTSNQPVKSSSAYILGTFTNIAPIAKSVEYTVQEGSDKKVTLDLLNNVNDDGDGLVSALTDDKSKNKLAYFTDANKQDLAIRITKMVNPLVFNAERSGPCPGEDRIYTCYGGKITAQYKNTLDPFGYQFSYVVYDADGKTSNDAIVKLNNTATSDNSVRNSGGGGAIGGFGILGLLGLLGYRRYKNQSAK